MKRILPIRFYIILILGVFFILADKMSLAQVQQKDFKDVTNKWRNIIDTLTKGDLIVGKNYLSILPVIGYAPANGFLAGGAISFSRLMGRPPTNMSTGMLNFQVTTKGQFIINARSKIYLPGNKWFLQGDWRLLLFSQPTYGLGINNSEFNKTHIYTNNMDQVEGGDTLAEPMKFKLVRFYEEGTRRLGNSRIYAGLGIMIDQHFSILDERLDTVTGSPTYYITNHYKYSDTNSFNPLQYGTNGFKITVLTDTRDNISNCQKGYYASISLLNNIKIGNNSQQSMQLLYDARYYLGLSRRTPRHLIAFWSYGSILLNGNVPYLALPAIGWDTYNRSGRGFIQGRYRGLSMIYNELEYRFPISKNGLFGGVLFVNATTASNYSKKLFDKTAFGRGAGVRMHLDKRARTNLTIDIGLGADRTTAIYFNLQETF